jgi:hypothetical protein
MEKFTTGKQNASRTGLFLIELILSIFFFILSTAVVLQLFVKSHFISNSTVSINNALIYSQNMSEVFLANNGDFNAVKDLYQNQLANIYNVSDDTIVLLFDNDWETVYSFNDADYCIVAYFNEDEAFSYLNVYVNDYSATVAASVINGDYKSALLDTGYIYHQEVKDYNGD